MEFDEDDNCAGGLVPKFGAIFMSNSATKKECLNRKIFGLPLAKANFVKQVKSGMILFLFEFERRELHGVFQAKSDGTLNLNSRAFTSSGKQFPAQVQIAPIWSCRPLPEVVFRDAIKDNYYSPNKFHFGLSAQQVRVLLHLFYSRRLEEGKSNFGRSHGIGIDSPDFQWGKKRKMEDDGRFPSNDASESEVLDNSLPWHATGANCGRDTLGTVHSAADSTFLLNSSFSNEHIGNSLLGLVGADRETLMIEDRLKSVNNNGGGIEPDFLPVFPSYFPLSEDIVVADDYRFSKEDGVENACDVEGCIRPNFTSELVSNDAPDRTVPYDPDFPDIKYQCSSQVLDVAQDLSSHRVHDENFLPLSTSECVTHEAPLGSLYSEAPGVKASVFSRLSVAPRKHKKEHKKSDGLALIDEIMDSLHQAHNRWVKGSVGAKSRYVYVHCEEESKFMNQLQVEQPVVTKEITADVDCLVEEEYDVPKETRVVDFKRRSKNNKYLDEMVSKVSAGTTMGSTSKTTNGDLAGRAGKKRKLVRPDFTKERSHESGVTLERFGSKEKNDEINSQVVGGVNECEQKSSLQANLWIQDLASSLKKNDEINSHVVGGVNECEQKSSLQANLWIQDLASSLASGSNAQEQPSFISGVTAVPKKFGEEETADLNHQVGNADITLEHKCSRQSLQFGRENPATLSIQDLASSLATGSSSQEQPSFISGVTAVPKILEEEETADTNKEVGNVDITLEHNCSLQSLKG